MCDGQIACASEGCEDSLLDHDGDSGGTVVTTTDGGIESDEPEVTEPPPDDPDQAAPTTTDEHQQADGGTVDDEPNESLPSCGNGSRDANEACDDGSTQGGDGCDSQCNQEAGWACDANPSDQCEEVCGDSLVVGDETNPGGCDDGDREPGDGCDATCRVEPEWVCSGQPSRCARTCGDGLVSAGEDCDDGNATAGDGCFACVQEFGWTCSGAPSLCTEIDDCEPVPCANGGTCFDLLGDFECECQQGYAGSTCGEDIDECVDGTHNCSATQRCVNTAGSFTCVEADEGRSCEAMTGTECNGESCCTSLPVPTTTVTIVTGAMAEPVIELSAYMLDKYEVTAGRFGQFVADYDDWLSAGNPAEGAGAHPLIPGTGWNADWELPASAATLSSDLQCAEHFTWDAPNQQLPIGCVGWVEAFAFCLWDGQRLPTDAEWYAAATGGDQARTYPWGSAEPDETLVVNADGDVEFLGLPSVGSRPLGAAFWGHLDMAGSLSEITLDRVPGWVEGTCTDCIGLMGPPGVIRSGSPVSSATISNGRPIDTVGFRCAR